MVTSTAHHPQGYPAAATPQALHAAPPSLALHTIPPQSLQVPPHVLSATWPSPGHFLCLIHLSRPLLPFPPHVMPLGPARITSDQSPIVIYSPVTSQFPIMRMWTSCFWWEEARFPAHQLGM